MISSTLHPILASPQLPNLIRELQEYWAAEQQRRAEFYDWVTPDMKAEFIEGEIIVHSPVRFKHNLVLKRLLLLLDAYVEPRQLGYVGIEKLMTRFTRNDYEPDLCFFTRTKSQSFTPEQTVFPIPDLIVEVLSVSTEARDRGVKYEDYEAHGVQEYWIIDAEIEEVEQYVLTTIGRKQSYSLQCKGQAGTLQSQAIPGLMLPIEALFDEDAYRQTPSCLRA